MLRRVLIVNPSHLTDFDGKTFRLRRYAEALEEMGYSIDFVTTRCRSLKLRNKYRIFEVPLNLRSVYGGDYRPILTEIANSSKLVCEFCVKVFSLIKNGDYSLVLSSFDSSSLSTITAIIAAKLKHIPHIYDMDDLGPETSQAMKGWSNFHPFYKMQLFVERVTCKHSDVTFVVSEIMKKMLGRTGVNDKIEVIHNVPYVSQFRSIEPMKRSREKLGIATEPFIFAFIGNIQLRVRNLEILIKAVNILKDRVQDFIVLIIGTGIAEEYIKEKVCRAKLSKYFLFTEEVSNEKAFSYLNASNVSLIILHELLADHAAPTKLFISLALGKNILAMQSKQIRLMLGLTPVYLEKQLTAKKMAEAMLEAKRRFLKEDVNRESRSLFCSQYHWEREREKFARTVKKLIHV